MVSTNALRLLGLLLLVSSAASVMAHEYWLDPVGTQWRAGEELRADIRNGEDFTGTPFPFDPQGLARGGLISDHQRHPLTGRLGDYPAIRIPLSDTGLNLLLLETTRRELTYADYTAFENFLDYHALADIEQRHRDRALPENGIVEHYYRYCKALFHVDAAETGSDSIKPSAQTLEKSTDTAQPSALQLQNQRFELVALENPFMADSLELQLLFEDSPVLNRQVELFHRDKNDIVVRTTAVTDETGVVRFDISASGDYLVNSVLVVEPESGPAHWNTLWASLFFQQTER